MNMVLHGVLTPTIRRRNTLEEDIREVSERFDVVLTNPPFGGKENRQIRRNFPVQVQETALLFLQHIMKKLKQDGRCGVVVPEALLSTRGAFAIVKKELLALFDVNTIIALPPGVFLPYSPIRTNLVFFNRTGPTKDIWYYELTPPPGVERFSKAQPLEDAHLEDCRGKLKERAISPNSWFASADEIRNRGYDFTARNPRRQSEITVTPVETLVSQTAAAARQAEETIHEALETLPSLTGVDAFPIVEMSKFLKLRRAFFVIQDEITYRRVTVQLHGRGVIHRDWVLGSRLKTKKQQRIKGKDLLVAEIDAKVGGFGLVPPELDGAIVSSHYFVYELDTGIISPDYLHLYLKSGIPENAVQECVKGSLNYASIRPEDFLKLQIPLPPILTQRDIASQVLRLLESCLAQQNVVSKLDILRDAVLVGLFHGP